MSWLVVLLALTAWTVPAGAWFTLHTGSGWQGFTSDSGNAVALDATGDAYVGGLMWNETTATDFVVVKASGSTGEAVWRFETSGTAVSSGGHDDEALDVALDGAGGVFAVGSLFMDPTGLDFTVVKISAATGAEVWRRQTDGLAGGLVTQSRDVARSVAVDSTGAVVAAGVLDNDTTSNDLFVVKYSSTGTLEWSRTIDGPTSESDAAHDVVVDANDDVFVAGQTNIGVQLTTFTVMKLDGATGAELWRHDLNDGGERERALAMAVDSTGDVLVAGATLSNGFMRAAVLKFDGATGAEEWSYEAGFLGSFDHIAVDAAGDALAVGNITSSEMRVVKIDGATGAEVWRNDDEAPGATGLAITPAGDPVVSTAGLFRVLKFDGSSGNVSWRAEFDGNGFSGSSTRAVAVQANGDVVATGLVDDDTKKVTRIDLAIAEMRGLDGALGGLAGRSLRLKDPGTPEKRRMSFVVKDSLIRVPPAATNADPSLHGATLRLWNPATLESQEFVLPAGADWKLLGNPAGSKGYKFKSKTAPCKSLLIKPGKLWKASCGSSTAPLTWTLDEASQGELAISLQMGDGALQCAAFGGFVVRDEPGFFLAKNASALPDCP